MVVHFALVVGLVCGGAWATQSATEVWPDCSATMSRIQLGLDELNQGLRQAESASQGEAPVGPWAVSTPTSNEPLFFQRLQAYDNWQAGRARLERIERDLQQLEGEIEQDRAVGRTGPDLERLSRLARSQRLVVEELKFQLDSIHNRFKELDRQIDAHEMRIDAVQGGLNQATSEFRETAARLRAHLVASPSVSYGDVSAAQDTVLRDLDLAQIFAFPRTEMRFEDTTSTTSEVTVSAEASLFGIVKGTAKGGAVFDTRYSTEAFVMAPNTQPLLSRAGTALRDAAVFCAVSKTHTYKGFGSVGGSLGFDIRIIRIGTGASVEKGATFSSSSKRFSRLNQFRQGETFQSKLAECRQFAKETRDQDALSAEVSGMIRITGIPASSCYKNYDCRNPGAANRVPAQAVSECVATATQARASCQPRTVDTEGIRCLMPAEQRSAFTGGYPCAQGLRCDARSRRCVAEKTGRQWLTEAGIAEAKVARLKANYAAIRTQGGQGTPFCESQGLKGWKLPAPEQLRAVSHWYREQTRLTLRQQRPRPPALSWYYAPQLFTGWIWSDGPSVYLLGNDSATPFHPEDPQHAVLFAEPATGRTLDEGVAICVRQ